jgi:hypothetical protein
VCCVVLFSASKSKPGQCLQRGRPPAVTACNGHLFCVFLQKVEVTRYMPLTGALGERRYSPYLSSTSALEGDKWSASRPGRALPLGKESPVPNIQEAGWAPEPVWTQRLEEKSSASVGDRTPVAQSVVRHCTD